MPHPLAPRSPVWNLHVLTHVIQQAGLAWTVSPVTATLCTAAVTTAAYRLQHRLHHITLPALSTRPSMLVSISAVTLVLQRFSTGHDVELVACFVEAVY